MRRLPAAAWIFAPLAIGLLYAAGHALLAPRPTLANLTPADAILVQRFRDLEEFDRSSFGPRGPSVWPARDVLATERNLTGLPGVDAKRPLLMVLMPRTVRPDSTMAVLPVSDADRLEAEFERPDFVERNLARHAQHLVIHGPWAAVAPRRDDARRLGTGGINAADLGEDIALAAHVPELIEHAAGLVKGYPWREIFEALGADVEAARLVQTPDGALEADIPGIERIGRIGAAWRTARLWAWVDEGRLRVELEARPGPLADALADFAGVGPWPTAPPADAEAWIAVPGDLAAQLTARLVHHAGVEVPAGLRLTVTESVSGARPLDAGPKLIWGEPALGTGAALTIGVLGEIGAGFHVADLPQPEAGGEGVLLPRGAAPVTKGDSASPHPSPKGEVWLRRLPDGRSVLTFGASARRALERMAARAVSAGPLAPPPSVPEGYATLARFALRQGRAARILDRALEPGGVLACLAGGDLEGELLTNGRTVRLEVRVVR